MPEPLAYSIPRLHGYCA